jgi:galactose mutarotase-like enzyme
MLQIENDNLRVSFRLLGAEMVSVYDKAKQVEHLWQADKNIWGWHAPVLFPIVGRAFNDVIRFDGINYNIEKHGFARKSDFKVSEQNNNSITFSLSSNEATLAQFPFRFEFQINYSLDENKLLTQYQVKNCSESAMQFNIGGHPAFNVPFNDSELYEDYYIEFPNDKHLKRHFINESGFFNGEQLEILDGQSKLHLNSKLFKDDALIFKALNSKTIFLKSKNHNSYLSFEFEDFNYLGLWAKTDAKYVCIEPWIGCADNDNFNGEFIDKESVITLQPTKTVSCSFTLGIHQ